MKKLVWGIMTVLLLFALCACGSTTKKVNVVEVKKSLCDGFWHHQESFDTAVNTNGIRTPYTLYLTDVYIFSEDGTYDYTSYSYTTLFGRVDKSKEVSGKYSIEGNKILLSDGGMEGETEIYYIMDEITNKISFHVSDSSGETSWKQYRITYESEDFIAEYFAVP